MNRSLMTGLAVVSLVVLGAVWFVSQYELVAEEESVPPGREAWGDPYLAAMRMFDRLSLKSSRLVSLESGPSLPEGALLVAPGNRGVVSRPALARVLDHVERGGVALVESEAVDQPDPLFDRLGIARTPMTWKGRAIGMLAFSRYQFPYERTAMPVEDAGVTRLTLPGDAPSLQVYLAGGESLAHPDATHRIGGPEGTRALVVPVGRGLVVAVNDLSFAQNYMIGRGDNAEFLWRVSQLHPGVRSVLVLTGTPEHLGGWLWRHAAPTIVLVALWIAFALWRAMPRFGPMLPEPEAGRRRLGDHLLACGRYFWSIGRGPALGTLAARSAMAAVLRREPHLGLAASAQRVQWLVQRYDLAPVMADHIVALKPANSAPMLVAVARACRRLHLGASSPAVSTKALPPTALPPKALPDKAQP